MENVFFRKNARSGIGGSEGSCHIDVLVFMPDVKLPDRWMDPRHWLREMSASLHDYTVADVKKKHEKQEISNFVHHKNLRTSIDAKFHNDCIFNIIYKTF